MRVRAGHRRRSSLVLVALVGVDEACACARQTTRSASSARSRATRRRVESRDGDEHAHVVRGAQGPPSACAAACDVVPGDLDAAIASASSATPANWSATCSAGRPGRADRAAGSAAVRRRALRRSGGRAGDRRGGARRARPPCRLRPAQGTPLAVARCGGGVVHATRGPDGKVRVFSRSLPRLEIASPQEVPVREVLALGCVGRTIWVAGRAELVSVRAGERPRVAMRRRPAGAAAIAGSRAYFAHGDLLRVDPAHGPAQSARDPLRRRVRAAVRQRRPRRRAPARRARRGAGPALGPLAHGSDQRLARVARPPTGSWTPAAGPRRAAAGRAADHDQGRRARRRERRGVLRRRRRRSAVSPPARPAPSTSRGCPATSSR